MQASKIWKIWEAKIVLLGLDYSFQSLSSRHSSASKFAEKRVVENDSPINYRVVKLMQYGNRHET